MAHVNDFNRMPYLVPTMARPCLSPKQVDDVLAAFFALVGVDPDDLPSLTTPAHFTSPPSTPPLHLTSPTESRTKSSHRGHVKQQRQLLSSKKSLPAGHIVPPGEMKRKLLSCSHSSKKGSKKPSMTKHKKHRHRLVQPAPILGAGTSLWGQQQQRRMQQLGALSARCCLFATDDNKENASSK
ncbi:hypothetical protein NSK_005350 [Nannochloropsis salina CCMP1776]|uniref:Uncharacterized protein n=1 Tax=Nannochloropsis salina CCMP1776 TaxID=1027361 RepID=A0A4D9D407_9STRA|nr:hypothetical protein NSK_005350 [Nannochloropsis salina CCMP1776]|eukprot:TFJ83348.1 hypothetical protein NSK_005350 [Nannochloropsis salina CCMP1776]